MIDAGAPRDHEAPGDWPPPPPPPPSPIPASPAPPPSRAVRGRSRPGVVTAALWLVGIGCVIAVLDIVANTVGVGVVCWTARENIDSVSLVVVLVAVPALLNLAVWVGTMLLLRRTAARSSSARVGLAGVMFGCVPGAVINFSLTEVFLLVFALSSWGGSSRMPDWTGGVLLGSMIADGVLLLIALAAGILLVLPGSRRWTTERANAQATADTLLEVHDRPNPHPRTRR